MATIATMAVKVMANIGSMEKNMSAASASIERIAKMSQNATPSMKNLADTAQGLSVMMNAASEAQNKLASAPADQLQETQKIAADVSAAVEQMKTSIQTMGEGVAGDILNMQPTLSNVQKAQKEIEQLKALRDELAGQGISTDLLGGAIRQAEENMVSLSNSAIQTRMEMKGLDTVLSGLNHMPFMILSNILTELITGLKTWGAAFNQHFGGVPGRILSITAGVAALTVAAGLASARMTALGASVSYVTTLWKSSVIYQGLSGVIVLMNTWLGTQIAVNAATTLWVGIATMGIGLIVAAVAAMVMAWNDNTEAIEDSKNRMKEIGDETQKVIDRFETLNNSARSVLESLMTPAQKLVNKLKEIGEIAKTPEALEEQWDKVQARQKAISAEIQKRRDNWEDVGYDSALTKQLKQEYDENRKLLEKLNEALRGAVKMTEEQKKAAEEAARQQYLQQQYGDLIKETTTAEEQYLNIVQQVSRDMHAKNGERMQILENAQKKLVDALGIGDLIKPVVLPQDTLADTMTALADALKQGAITQEQYNTGVAAAQKKMQDSMGISELIKPVVLPQDTLKTQMNNLALALQHGAITQEQYNTGVAAAQKKMLDAAGVSELIKPVVLPQDTLKTQMNALADALQNGMITQEQYNTGVANAGQKLADSMGIKDYLTDVQTAGQKLADVYNDLAEYARLTGMSQQELTDAQDRAKNALMKQSEYYSLHQKAQDALISPQTRLAEEYKRIDAEAQQFGWDTNVIQKMKDFKKEELLGKQDKTTTAGKNKDSGKDSDAAGGTKAADKPQKVDQSRNAALEYGTTAYYESVMHGNNNLLDENKRQTKHLSGIERALTAGQKAGSNNNNSAGGSVQVTVIA